MLSAYLAAARQLGDPPIKRVIWRVGLWTAAVYVLLGIGLWSLVAGFDPTGTLVFTSIGWLNSLLTWIAAKFVGTLVVILFIALFWLLFVVIVQLVASFYLEDVVAAVEARHYAHLPPAAPPPIFELVIATARYFGMLVLLNLLALPFYLIPLFGVVVFYLVNGYLIGREYYELVALRRIDAGAAGTLRHAQRGKVLGAGLITTILFSVPLINLVAPIVAAAAMVHIFEGMAGRRPTVEADDA